MRAADNMGIKVACHDVADDGIFRLMDEPGRCIIRIGPKSYIRYQEIARTAKSSERLQLLERVLVAFDKCRSYEVLHDAGVAMPQTNIITSVHEKPAFLPCVVKVAVGNQGKGVFLVETQRDFENIIERCLADGNCLYQEYIPESKGSDKRLIICNGDFIAAMQRTASGTDFRANLHLGGTATAYNPTQEEIALAVKAVSALGINFAGVDLIDSRRGPLVLEVNPSPGFAIGAISGIDVAQEVIARFKEETNA